MPITRWRHRALCAVLCVVGLPVTATAEHVDLPDPDTEIARRHFDAGTALYADSKYAEAMVEFESAKRAKPLPAFDYNIARCLDRLERWAEAMAAYERYANAEPATPESAVSRDRAHTLRQRLAPPLPLIVVAPAQTWLPSESPGATPAATTPAAAREEPRPSLYRRWWLWTAIGGGVLLVGGAIGVGVGVSQATQSYVIPPTTDGNYIARF